MFSFWARRKGGKKKKVEIIFTPLKKAEEQLASNIFSLSIHTHAFCHLAEIRNWSKFLWQGKKAFCYIFFKWFYFFAMLTLSTEKSRVEDLLKKVHTTRDTEPFIHYFHWLHSNVRFVYFNDCVKYSSCKVSEIPGFLQHFRTSIGC